MKLKSSPSLNIISLADFFPLGLCFEILQIIRVIEVTESLKAKIQHEASESLVSDVYR